MRSKPSEITPGRGGERGAALVMSLLVAMLLLAAGGALIATAGMTVSNAVDSTAEVQAYYAADAGLQAALTVIRRNRAAASGLAADFHNFACGTAATCVNDTYDLSAWLPYQNGRVPLLTTSTLPAYTVTVSDPSLTGAANVLNTYTPRFLTIESVGYGERGAIKRMRMLVDRNYFDFTPKSTLLMRGAENCANMTTFEIGQSNAKDYSGNDGGNPPQPSLPVFGTTCAGNTVQATNVVNGSKPNTVTSNPQGKVSQLTNSDIPAWLQNANDARALLLDLAARADGMGRYFTSQPTDFGSAASPKLTFVDGDCDLSNGGGLLVVTGELTMKGNANFSGLILVLGKGEMTRNGGGNGDILGAIVVAKFARTWPASENNQPHPFLAPVFDTNGGGNSTVQYNSTNVNNAMNSLGNRILGVQEF
jgi:hypothetical protein